MVLDKSEICGASGDVSQAINDFAECIIEARLVTLPMRGSIFSWHSRSFGTRSLWKQLDRVSMNKSLLTSWPGSYYICSMPRTSNHGPLVLGSPIQQGMFQFDNFLSKEVDFLQIVAETWQHRIYATQMYSVV